MSKGKKEGETNQGRQTKTNQPILFTLENTLMVTGRGGAGGTMGTGMKEDTCRAVRWGMQGSGESLYCTPETDITLYVNFTGIQNRIR